MPMISRNLAAGAYTIVFEGYSTSDVGSYTIRVRSGSAYTPLTRDVTKAPGNITASTDVDWYSFTVTTQDVYTIRANAGTLKAANMFLYMDGDPMPLTWNQGENPPDSPMPMITCALDPGTYYVAVEGYGLSDLGNYTMEFLSAAQAASVYTTLIDNWLGIYGNISSATDEDYYTFVVLPEMSNNTFTLRTSPGDLTGETNLTKGHMALYSYSGALIAESTGTEPGANQKMPYIQKKLPAGTYYVAFIGDTTADLGYYGIELLRTNP